MESTSPNQPVPGSTKKNNNLILGVVAVAILLVVAAGAYIFKSKNHIETGIGEKLGLEGTTSSSPTSAAGQEMTASPVVQGNYKDGVYDVKGDYVSPGGPEQLDVQITLKNNVVVDSTVTSLATRPQTQRFQGIFIQNYKPMVIGKNIDEVHLTKVSGSSLSPGGFNDALEKIKAQAKV